MGFFSLIGDGLKAVVRGIGEFIEGVGDVTGIEFIGDLGRGIQDICAEKVASEKSYDKKEANIYTTDRLNDILVAFSEGYFQEATRIEKECVQLVQEYYDKMISLIENTPGGDYNRANLKMLKNSRSRISKTIKGGIKEPLAKRMSLDDSECLRILKLDSGEEKKKKMKNFERKVIKGALRNLSNKVKKTLSEQTEDIQDYLSGISEEQEKAMQALKEQFDKMVEHNELEQSDKEMNCVMPLYIVDATECIFDTLK